MAIPFEFNRYSSLLLPAFIQGLLFTLLSLARFGRQKRLYDLFLAGLLGVLSIRLSFWMLGFAGWYDRHNGFATFMFYFPFNTLAFIGPCLYFYFLSLTNRNFVLTKRHWPHLILPISLLLLGLVKCLIDFLYYYPFPPTEPFQYGTRGPFAEWDKTAGVYWLSYGSLLGYVGMSLHRFKHYRTYLVNNFADLEPIELTWLQRLLHVMVGLSLVLVVFYLSNYWIRGPAYQLNWYPYLLLGIGIYYVAINGFAHSPAAFNSLQFEVTAPPQAPSENVLPDLHEWKQLVHDLMSRQQLYLETEVSLPLVAKQLKTTPQLLSKVINEGYGLNFNDYINQWRVEAVVEQFRQKAHYKYSLIAIAYDCGFNSKTTFNRAFKKVTGQTPGGYIQQLEGSNDHLGP